MIRCEIKKQRGMQRRTRLAMLEQLERRDLLAANRIIDQQFISDSHGGLSEPIEEDSRLGESAARLSLGDRDVIVAGAPNFGGALYLLELDMEGKVSRKDVITTGQGFQVDPGLTSVYRFGNSMANLGDLDSDGNDDLAVFGIDYSNVWRETGVVFVLFMDRDGTVKRHELIHSADVFPEQFHGVYGESEFGFDLASADINGDNRRELFIRAELEQEMVYQLSFDAQGSREAARQYSKQELGVPDQYLLRYGPHTDSLISAGDLDGDGSEDLIVIGTDTELLGDHPDVLFLLLMNQDGSIKATRQIGLGSGGVQQGFSIRNEVVDYSIGTADFNGDGRPELIVPQTDDDVLVCFLNSDLDVEHTLAWNTGKGGFAGTKNDAFGTAFQVLGDLNRDGVDDLLVGEAKAEKLHVVFMDASGEIDAQTVIADSHDSKFKGPLDDNSYFGYAVADVGDINGDDVPDLLVSTMDERDQDSSAEPTVAGEVHLLFMDRDGTVKRRETVGRGRNFVGTPIELGESFGAAVASIGDLNQDGIDEIAIGSANGTVRIVNLEMEDDQLGNAPTPVATEVRLFNEQNTGIPGLGTSIAGIGDVNGDGIPDMAVGTPYEDGDTTVGMAYVWLLNADASIQSSALVGSTLASDRESQFARRFGASITGLGDLNGDGINDIAISDPNDKHQGEIVKGTISIVLLNSDGSISARHDISDSGQRLLGDTGLVTESIGNSIASVGDIDGNGASDLLFTTTGPSGGSVDDRIDNAWLLLITKSGEVISTEQLLTSPTHDGASAISSLATWSGPFSFRFDPERWQTRRFVTGYPYYSGAVSESGSVAAGVHRGAIGLHTVQFDWDHGDAPESGSGTSRGNYNTYSFYDGPSHHVVNGLHMGEFVDAEREAKPNRDATGDDADPSISSNDEDGLVDAGQLMRLAVGDAPRIDIQVTNLLHRDAKLAGWIDYNGNGEFETPVEYAEVIVPPQTESLRFTLTFPVVPLDVEPDTFARFRITTAFDSELSSNGHLPDGEVEDHAVKITPQLTSYEVGLVKNINQATAAHNGNSFPSDFIQAGDLTFFEATSQYQGTRDLWVTDGSEQGTIKVAVDVDLGDGRDDAIVYGGELYFSSGGLLMKSDGTVDGTYPLKHGINGETITSASSFAVWQSKLYFNANGCFVPEGGSSCTSGNVMYVSDGTDQGTSIVVGSTNPTNLRQEPIYNAELTTHVVDFFGFNPYLVYRISNALWANSTLPESSTQISAIGPVTDLITVGERLFYFGYDAGVLGLYFTDGTSAGTGLAQEFSAFYRFDDDVTTVAETNYNLYFYADGGSGYQLWTINVADLDAIELTDLSGLLLDEPIVTLNGDVYFATTSGLWKVDTSDQSVSQVAALPVRELTAWDGSLFFASDTEVWISDGTQQGTIPLSNLGFGAFGGYPRELTAAGNYLYFQASTNDAVFNEPYRIAKALPPSLAIADATVIEGDAGTAQLEFVVELSGNTVPFSVDFATADASADASDYSSQSGTLSFQGMDGETKTITVEVLGDTLVELEERLSVSLSNVSPAGVILADAFAFGSIVNDDEAHISVSSPSVAEDSPNDLLFEVTLDRAIDSPVWVEYFTADGTASNRDYTSQSGELRFQGHAGETIPVLVSVRADSVVELDETIRLELTNVESLDRPVQLPGGPGVGTIVNDDTAIITVSSATVVEGDSGFQSARFAIQLSNRLDRPIGLSHQLVLPADSGLPSPEQDEIAFSYYFEPRATRLWFARGSTQRTYPLTVSVRGDEEVEQDEYFQLQILSVDSGGRAFSLGTTEALGKIIDDDQAFDFGDAPDSYPVLLRDDGARHQAVGPTLGASRDLEANGQPSRLADGDDQDTQQNDEDGIRLLASVVASANAETVASLVVVASGPAFLDGWIDFNIDGSWDGQDEQIFASEPVVAGDNLLNVMVPANAVPGESAARFRLSSAGQLQPTGAAANGEVEDYVLTILEGGTGPTVDLQLLDGQTTIRLETDQFNREEIVAHHGSVDTLRIPADGVAGLRVQGSDSGSHVNLVDLAGLLQRGFPLSIAGSAGVDTLELTGADVLIDLVSKDTIELHEFDVIDIAGTGDNRLTLDPNALLNVAPSNHTLLVRADAGDEVSLGFDWEVTGSEVIDGQLARILSSGEANLKLIGPWDWHNPVFTHDVNGDGNVEPIDALLIINELNAPRYSLTGGSLVDAAGLAVFPIRFFDTVPDGQILPLDALVVINQINRQERSSAGEAEAATETLVEAMRSTPVSNSPMVARKQNANTPSVSEARLLNTENYSQATRKTRQPAANIAVKTPESDQPPLGLSLDEEYPGLVDAVLTNWE